MNNIKLIVFLFAIQPVIGWSNDNKLALPYMIQDKAETPGIRVVATSTIYYVSILGNDNNNGTSPSTPWKTISKVNAQTYNSGDKILFNGGQIFSGNILASSSGAAKSYIEYGSYGIGRALINAGIGTGFYVKNKSYVWVNNLIIYGDWNQTSQTGNTGYGIQYYNDIPGSEKLGSCYVSSCDISGFQSGGIAFISATDAANQNGYTQIVATHNSVHDNGNLGIVSLGAQGSFGSTAYAFSYVYIGYNKVYNNFGLKAQINSHTGDGILIGDAGSGIIEHNVANNNGWYNNCTGGGPAAIWCYDSNGLVFQYNEAYNNGTGTGCPDGDGFDLDGGATNCIMQYNYSHNNYAAGFLVWEFGASRGNNNGNTIRYNISQGDGYKGTYYGPITSGPNCNNNKYYNNTLYSSNNPSMIIYGGTGNFIFNNIFFCNSTNPTILCSSSISSAYFLNNDYYGGNNPISINYNGSSYKSLSSFQTATHNEIYNGNNYGFTVNPFLNNPNSGGTFNNYYPNTLTNYQLTDSSSMINSGINPSLFKINPGVTDFNASTVPNGTSYDIGACEYH